MYIVLSCMQSNLSLLLALWIVFPFDLVVPGTIARCFLEQPISVMFFSFAWESVPFFGLFGTCYSAGFSSLFTLI